MESKSTPTPSAILFARGIIARLAIWTTLRIAIQENWGGPHGPAKRTWLASAIVDAFEDDAIPTPDEQYIEEMLVQVMEDEFETVVEDGSAESVSRDIIGLWEEIQCGKTDLVLKFEDLADKARGKRPNAQERVVSDDEDDDWEDEDDGSSENMEEVPELVDRSENSREPKVDEDGFTLVQSKRRK